MLFSLELLFDHFDNWRLDLYIRNLKKPFMKTILSLLCLLSFLIAGAQNDYGSISFTDGTKIQGLVKIRGNGKVKFKPVEESESVTYDLDKITSIKIEDRSYEVVEYKSLFGFSKTLMKVVVKGKATLLNDQVFYTPMMGANGTWTGGGTKVVFYLKKNRTVSRLGTRLNRKDDSLFEDCPKLLKQIDEREIKRRHLSEIVKFYNRNCE